MTTPASGSSTPEPTPTPSTNQPPAAEPPAARSTDRRMPLLVRVRLDHDIVRTLIVHELRYVAVAQRSTTVPPPAPYRSWRVSGTLCCEPSDSGCAAFRTSGLGNWRLGVDPAKIHGRPGRQQTTVYAELLDEGDGIGEWQEIPEGGK